MTIVTTAFDFCNVIPLGREERGACVLTGSFTCLKALMGVQSASNVVTFLPRSAAILSLFLNLSF